MAKIRRVRMKIPKPALKLSGFYNLILLILMFIIISVSGTPVFSISDKSISTKRLIGWEDIEDTLIEKTEIVPKIPEYSLPLKIKDIFNYQKFSDKIKLSPRALSLLQKNGFVVIPTPEDIAESEVFLPFSTRSAFPKDDFVAYYKSLQNKELPIFITTDSLLHYYHIFFNTLLMKMERGLFYQDLWEMSEEFFNDAVSQYNVTSGDLKEAARRNVAYFSVALKLLSPRKNQVWNDEMLREEYCSPGMSEELCEMIIQGVKGEHGEKASFKYFSESELQKYGFKIPDFVKPEVEEEIELIRKHKGWEFSPIFIYKEDYSQYLPRGHYTQSERLKNYFRTMMWYGRMIALIKGSSTLSPGESMCTGSMDGIISQYDAKIQTLQASLMVRKFLESESIRQKWQRIYTISCFFVGFSDDLGPYEYTAVLKSLFGEKFSPQELEKRYEDLRDALWNLPYHPKIYSGLGACELSMPCPPLSDKEIEDLKTQAEKLVAQTKGFRLMGQRFTVDSWLFSQIVSPYSGEYIGEKSFLPTEEKPFTFWWDDSYPEYRKNRPFTWVRTEVKACPPPGTREVRGFPRGLDIMALLGSKRAREILKDLGDTRYSDYEKKFFELKEEIDSFSTSDWFRNLYWNWLYVLRSLLDEFGEGYQTFMQTKAWQDKQLNTALASWTQLRHDTILYVKQSYTMAELGAEPSLPVVGYVDPVPEFYTRLLNLTRMTKKGLQELLSPEEMEQLEIGYALDHFSDLLTRLLEISRKELENESLTEDEYRFIEDFGNISEWLIEIASGGDVDPDIFKTVLVADVHTEGNTRKVLEEGVGYIKTLIVAYKLPQEHILIGVGPIFSYYEFKQPMEIRLTDEAWRKILNTHPPSEPEWIKSFSE